MPGPSEEQDEINNMLFRTLPSNLLFIYSCQYKFLLEVFGFRPTPVRVGFVVDRVTLTFLRILCCILSVSYHRYAVRTSNSSTVDHWYPYRARLLVCVIEQSSHNRTHEL